MKAFGIFTIMALTAPIDGSSALWCESKNKRILIAPQNLDAFRKYCRYVMQRDLLDGISFFKLTAKDWCDSIRSAARPAGPYMDIACETIGQQQNETYRTMDLVVHLCSTRKPRGPTKNDREFNQHLRITGELNPQNKTREIWQDEISGCPPIC